MNTTVIRILNAIFIIVLCGVITAAYFVQFYWREEPCPLCMLQRVAMIAIGSSLLLNLKFGIQLRHYGLAIISALFGGVIALRQITLHICPGFPTFGKPVWGFGLYTWAFLVFVCSIFAVAIFLICYVPKQKEMRKMHHFETFAAGYLFFIALTNILTTLQECGITACPR